MVSTSVSWGDVTVREFAALQLVADPDAIAKLNTYWDELYEVNPLRGESPTRLTLEGETWLNALHERYDTVTTPAGEAIAIAREVLNGLGILAVMRL